VGISVTFDHMKAQKTTTKRKLPDWENVKLPREFVDRLRKNRDKTMIPMGKFIVSVVSKELDKK
jgi:hypothetical protein